RWFRLESPRSGPPSSAHMPPFTHLEFHRTGIGLVPEGEGPETAIHVEQVPGHSKPLRSCTCAASQKKTCDHLQDLSRAVEEVQKAYARRSWEGTFARSIWHGLARLLYDGNPQPSAKVRVQRLEHGGANAVRVTAPNGEEMALYQEDSDAQ